MSLIKEAYEHEIEMYALAHPEIINHNATKTGRTVSPKEVEDYPFELAKAAASE